VSPFASCTNDGVDDGLTPEPFSLFLDVVPALLDGGAQSPHARALRDVSRSRCSLHCVVSAGDTSDPPLFLKAPKDCLKFAHSMRNFVKDDDTGAFRKKTVVLNSELGGTGACGAGAVVVNCSFPAGAAWRVGAKAVAIGFREADVVPDAVVAHRVPAFGSYVVVAHGVEDDVLTGLTCFGLPWDAVLARLHLDPADLWPAGGERTLARAALWGVGRPLPGWLVAACRGDADAAAPADWRAARRVSLAEAYVRGPRPLCPVTHPSRAM